MKMNEINRNKVAIVIPTLNALRSLPGLMESLFKQDLQSDETLIIDSSSSDDTVALAEQSGCTVRVIPRDYFSHGKTRGEALEHLRDFQYIVFLSQDAVLYGNRSIASLIEEFNDEGVGAAFGRQLPNGTTSHIEFHLRLFNYPEESSVRNGNDLGQGKMKLPFLSNSFAAYRLSALEDVGGFPDNVIMCEDMYVAAKMLLTGWKIAYNADARIFHSHNYSPIQYFKRSFDIGVFHGMEPWIRDKFGSSEVEGLRYVRSQTGYLMKKAPHLLPAAIFQNFLRYTGYRLGLLEKYLPPGLKRNLSMNTLYWNNDKEEDRSP